MLLTVMEALYRVVQRASLISRNILKIIAFTIITLNIGAKSGEAIAGHQKARGVTTRSRIDYDHSGVFGLKKINNKFQGESFSLISCSGVLLAPNLLLTARHCVSDLPKLPIICGKARMGRLFNAKELAVSNNSTVNKSSPWHSVAEILIPPHGDDICGFDLALIILAQNVPTNIAIPIVPNFSSLTKMGDEVHVIGYGRRRINEKNVGTWGIRMGTANLEIVCSGADCGTMVVETEFMTEAGPCEGDSGGPALDTQGRVVGILSRGSEPCATPIYASILLWRDFISQVAKRAAIRGKYKIPSWVDLQPSLNKPADRVDF